MKAKTILDLDGRKLELVTPHGKYTGTLRVFQYAEPKNWVLRLIDEDSPFHEPIATLSVNPTIRLADDEVAIKDWSENEGALASLLSTGWFEEEPVRVILSGHVQIDVIKLAK